MGYVIRLHDADFRIPENERDAALKTLNKKFNHDNYSNAPWTTLKQAMKDIGRWHINPPRTGDITGIEFHGEKAGWGEERCLKALAPHIKDGSYVEFSGEDGARYRLKVNGSKLETQEPEITYK